MRWRPQVDREPVMLLLITCCLLQPHETPATYVLTPYTEDEMVPLA